MKKLLLISICLICLFNAHAQHINSAGIFYDQDYTLEWFRLKKLNEDRNYTMGLGFYGSSNVFKKSFVFRPLYLLNSLFHQEMLNDRADQHPENSTSILLGNGSFTPDSLPAAYAIYNDRPYASLTYLELRTTHVNNSGPYVKRNSSLVVGVIGSYISREVQTAIHKSQNDGDTKDPRTPRGWNHQVSSGGEPTLLYSGETEWLISKGPMRRASQTSIVGFECKHGIKYSLGYYTLSNYIFSMRFGKIDPRNWSYVSNPLANSTTLAPSYLTRRPASEFYLFATFRPTFILYNAMLNGQFRHSDVRLSFGDMRHLVFDGEAGICLAPVIGNHLILTARARFSGRSPEIHFDSRPLRSHFWGGLDLLLGWY